MRAVLKYGSCTSVLFPQTFVNIENEWSLSAKNVFVAAICLLTYAGACLVLIMRLDISTREEGHVNANVPQWPLSHQTLLALYFIDSVKNNIKILI